MYYAIVLLTNHFNQSFQLFFPIYFVNLLVNYTKINHKKYKKNFQEVISFHKNYHLIKCLIFFIELKKIISKKLIILF